MKFAIAFIASARQGNNKAKLQSLGYAARSCGIYMHESNAIEMDGACHRSSIFKIRDDWLINIAESRSRLQFSRRWIFLKKLEIFDPALCCPTGVCGPNVDPELTRIASALFLLEGKGFAIKRYNLGTEPDAFVLNTEINQLLNEKGPEVLPIVVFDNEVVKQGCYPTNDELADWFGIDKQELAPKKSKKNLL